MSDRDGSLVVGVCMCELIHGYFLVLMWYRGGTSSPVPSADGQSLSPPTKTVVILELPWSAMGIDPTAGASGAAEGIRIALHRASHAPTCTFIPVGAAAARNSDAALLGQKEVDAILDGLVWSSWIAPTEDPDVVNFHRPGFFGKLKLVPPTESSIDAFGCACFAARLVTPNQLQVLPSPKPSLSECPDGALLVRVREHPAPRFTLIRLSRIDCLGGANNPPREYTMTPLSHNTTL